MKRFLAGFVAFFVMSVVALAQHPHPQPVPINPATGMPGSVQTYSTDLDGTPLVTVDTFSALPPDQNFLLTVDSDIFTSTGNLIPNTEPSTPTNPFNLHDGPVSTSDIDMTSPRDDLRSLIMKVQAAAKRSVRDTASIQMALDILEGNPIPSRPTYSGMALLHYTGPERIGHVQPISDSTGNVIGGNLNVHQIWFDNHIESDTALIDPTAVQNVPWTITYTIDVLHHGNDDFSPTIMYFDEPPAGAGPGKFGMPGISMDATFFPMAEGKRYVIKVKMAPAKYYNLTYTWGWRMHPPRVQVSENALKVMGGKTLAEWEITTFGPAPRSSRAAQLAAIAKIGELSPAKRMWQAFTDALASKNVPPIYNLMTEASAAFDDWSDRTRLPRGVAADTNSDITLFYVNNTIYGNGVTDFAKWQHRGTQFKATLKNGDHFVHGYLNVDFGGARGWENQFQSGYNDNPALSASDGCTFTFGRFHWWINAGGPWGAINVPPVSSAGVVGQTRVHINLNFEPSQRLRLYQFDPMHHDVAVYSLH